MKSCIALIILFLPLFTYGEGVSSCLNDGENNINPSSVNAHGGGVISSKGMYYWFGEVKGKGMDGNKVQQGVSLYESSDLCNWKYKGVAYSSNQNDNVIYLERPKVIYNKRNDEYIMWFHIDYRKGFNNESYARLGVAESKNIEGPYKFITSYRPNKDTKPVNFQKNDFNDMYFKSGYESGFDSRDFTLFKDDDGKAYVIYNSEMNNTLHVALLDDTYTRVTNEYSRVLINGRNEAPVIFKIDKTYFMITSGLTGWKANQARLFESDNIFGPWIRKNNPIKGTPEDIATTFNSQSAFSIEDKLGNLFIFGDRWSPHNPIESKYVVSEIKYNNGNLSMERIGND